MHFESFKQWKRIREVAVLGPLLSWDAVDFGQIRRRIRSQCALHNTIIVIKRGKCKKCQNPFSGRDSKNCDGFEIKNHLFSFHINFSFLSFQLENCPFTLLPFFHFKLHFQTAYIALITNPVTVCANCRLLVDFSQKF